MWNGRKEGGESREGRKEGEESKRHGDAGLRSGGRTRRRPPVLVGKLLLPA